MGLLRLSGKLIYYLIIIGIVIAVFPILAGIALGSDYRGSAESLSFLPGIEPEGGVKTAFVGFGYAFVVWGAFMYLGDDTENTQSPNQAQPAVVTDTPETTPDPTVNPTPTATATSTPTSTVTATSTPTPTDNQTGWIVTVIEVVDGDTLDVRYQNGTTATVRLLGIDSPEVNTDNDPAEFEGVPNTNSGEACLREEGLDASMFMKQTVLGKQVRITFDERADRRGTYGRLLTYVYLNSTNLNYRLVAEGYARVYDSTFTQSERFYSAETQAQNALQGVWRCRDITTPTPTPTRTPTPTPTDTPEPTQPGELSVWEVHEDAVGNDHENLNDEYIVFKNTGDKPLDISGWTVSDEADHTYTVPDGFTLDPGATVTLYTGSGGDSSDELYWGSDSAIWNNGGDTVIVKDDSGNTVIEHSYS